MSQAVASKYRQFCPKCLDFHAHFLHQQTFDECTSHSVLTCFGAFEFSLDAPVFRKMFDPAMQIDDMDETGIDLQVLSSADVMQSRTWATPADEDRMNRIVNDECRTWIDRFPDRFIGTAALPLGNMSLALAELERALSMGLRILNLPSNYRGMYLGHERYGDLWSAVLERDMVVFIHPDGTQDRWFQNYAMWNSIGQSIEEVKVMSSLIYEGVMDRYKGVKIVMAHGGGYMPYYMGRLDRNVHDKPFTAKNLSKLPSEYLKDFYYDTCVYDARTLEILIEKVGVDRVVIGGDYPVGGYDPIDELDKVRLPDNELAKIAGTNALRLLGMS